MYDVKPHVKELKKIYGIDLKDSMNLSLSSHTTLQGDHALITTKLVSAMANFEMKETKYSFHSNRLEGDYTLESANLSKLIQMTGLSNSLPQKIKNYDQSLKIRGTIVSDRDLYVNGKTDILGGKIDFSLNKNDFKLNLLNLRLKRALYTLKANGEVNYNLKKEEGDAFFTLAQGNTLLEVKKARFNQKKRTVDADFVMSGYKKSLRFIIKGALDDPNITLKSDTPLISERYKKRMIEEINANLKGSEGEKSAKKLIAFLSRSDSSLSTKEINEIEKTVSSMMQTLKKEYAKVKNVTFTKEHLENLRKLSEKMRKERGVLTDNDIKEIEKRSKKILLAIKKEWQSGENVQKRDEALAYFSRLGKVMEKITLKKSELETFKREFNQVIDSYQRLLRDKRKIQEELKKYEPIEKIAKLFGDKKGFDQAKIIQMIESFSLLLDHVQKRIEETDLTQSQQNILKEIGRAFSKAPEIIK